MPKTSRPASRPGRLVMVVPTLLGLMAGVAGGAAWSWRQTSVGAVAVGPEGAPMAEAVRTGPMAREVMLGLVRSTLAAVQHANETGNYAVLRDLGAPGFREANPPDRLAQTFQGQRQARLDLTGALFTDPVLTLPPRLEASGMMRLAGYFPAGQAKLDFDLLYQPVDGRWRLFGIATAVSRTQPRLAQAGLP